MIWVTEHLKKLSRYTNLQSDSYWNGYRTCKIILPVKMLELRNQYSFSASVRSTNLTSRNFFRVATQLIVFGDTVSTIHFYSHKKFFKWSYCKYRSNKFTIAIWRKVLNQTNKNHVKIITTRSIYNTLDATGEKQFHIMLKDTGDAIAILNEPACLLLDTNFMHWASLKKGNFIKIFTLSEIKSGQILNDHFRKRSYF